MQSLKTILHATDFSDLAVNAFHAAHAMARDHGARLILLYVKQPQETVMGEFGMAPPEPEPTDDQILDRLARLMPAGSPVKADALVVHGGVAESIVDVAKKKQCDVIVMGTHGRKGLGRLFHAQIADHVTHSAPCPVMALRSSATEG